MSLFIVGMWRDLDSPWEFCGVFDSQEAAEAACIDERFFVGPAALNALVPEERTDWPGCYFPKAAAVA